MENTNDAVLEERNIEEGSNFKCLFDSMTQEEIDSLSYDDKLKLIDSEISRLFITINMNPSYTGFVLLKDIVSYLVINNKRVFNLSKEIYPILSEKYNLTPIMIEKSIRLAIEQTAFVFSLNKGTSEIHNSYKNIFMKPQNKNFISSTAEIISSRIYNKKYNNFNY